MLSVVSARYARALVDVVTEPGSKTDPAQVLSQLRAVQALIHGSADAAERAEFAGRGAFP